MIKHLTTAILALLTVMSVSAQTKDTLEVQKIGDKFYVIVDHPKPDTAKQYVPAPPTPTIAKTFDSHLMIVGLATIGFVHNWSVNKVNTPSGVVSTKLSPTNSFGDVDHYEFSPMFLWRHSDKVLVEFEPSFAGGSLGVNWACISYFAYPGVIVRAGYLVLPFGTYNKRLAAGWICKLPTDPVSISNSPVGSDWGIELEGGQQVGKMKISYDVALTNGFTHSATDGSIANPDVNAVDNNLGKTVTGRFGWLPALNSGVEIGVSGLWGKAGDANTQYKNVSTAMGALDFQWVYAKKPVSINIKAEADVIYVSNASYTNPNPPTPTDTTYTYRNLSIGYYGMFSIRPIVSDKFLRNLELAVRYSAYDAPTGAAYESHSRQISAGICYWLNWRTVFKIGYENLITTNPDNAELAITNLKNVSNILYAQFSVQF
jgi:hypothetical protein